MQTAAVTRDNTSGVGRSGSLPIGSGEIESLANLSLLTEIDDELRRMGASFREENEKRSAINRDLSFLRGLEARPTSYTEAAGQREFVTLSGAERDRLRQIDPQLEVRFAGGGYPNGPHAVNRSTLRALIETKEETVASHNSNNELMMIRVQSLVDQRKNLFLLFSNLLASRSETMMNLVRNLRN